MEHCIKLINTVIDSCLNCGGSETCMWLLYLHDLGQKNSITSFASSPLTWDELACQVYSSVSVPSCKGQISYDSFMLKLEDLLKQASYPSSSIELIQLFQGFAAIESRLQRLPYVCNGAFDLGVYSAIEKCIAAIDYHYLMAGIDISEIIVELKPDYKREQVLNRHYHTALIKHLIDKSKKETLVSLFDKDKSFPVGVTSKAKSSDSIGTGAQYQTDKKAITKANSQFINIVEADHYSPLDTIIGILTNPSTKNWAAAVSMSLGFRPAGFHESYEYYEKNNFINNSLANHILFWFSDRDGLIKELSDEVKQRKGDPQELLLYFSDLLSPLQDISTILYPNPRDSESTALALALGYIYDFRDYSLKDYRHIVDGCYCTAVEVSEGDIDLFVETFIKCLNEEHFPPEEGSCDGILEDLFSLRQISNTLELCIEAALLFNGVTHDCLYYQNKIGITLGTGVNAALLAGFTGKTLAFIRELAIDYGHRLKGDVREGDDHDSFMERLINNPDETILADLKPNAEVSSNVIDNYPELVTAYKDGYIKEDGTLIRSRADFVRFCVSHKFFEHYGRKEFRRISGILKDPEGNPISEKQLAQTYSDNGFTAKGQ